eukprot:984430-Pleurochrysis_carterae.AAC.1
MSSIKSTIFLPPGGPKVRPCRFSTLASIWRWKMAGVVADESESFLRSVAFLSRRERYCITVAVLAVPMPPRSSTGLPAPMESESACMLRTESMVGTSSEGKMSPICLPAGGSHCGICEPQCAHSPEASSTRYS